MSWTSHLAVFDDFSVSYVPGDVVVNDRNFVPLALLVRT